MAQYESDLTKFMRRYLEEHPEEIASQAAGRGTWWDKTAGERSAPAPAHHAPRAGGAEYTFRALTDTD